MIAGALYVRGDIGGDGAGPISGTQPARLICVTELKVVCEELDGDGVEVAVEEAGVTAERLSAAQAVDADAWLTIAPWNQIVAEARSRNGLAALPPGDGAVLARSPLVTSVWRERGAVLDRHCKQPATWTCVATFAGQPWGELGGQPGWGQLKPGYADPTRSATGLLVLGSIASDFLGSTSFSARDLDDDSFLKLMTDLEAAVPDRGSPTNTPLAQQLQFGPGRFDYVGTIEAEAGPRTDSSARGDELELRYADTVAVAEVVLAPLKPGSGADRLQGLVEEAGTVALAESGWRVEGQPRAAGVATDPALPPGTNLPSAGALDALRGRWGEIR